jgi:hypothetical protein
MTRWKNLALSPERGRGSKILDLRSKSLDFAGLSAEALAKADEGESQQL